MRCYMIAAGTLFSAVAAFGQQNVVPQGVLNGSIYRALNLNSLQSHPPPLLTGQKPVVFLMHGPREGVCAIPLLEAPVTPTHDRIGVSRLAAPVDPKMPRAVGAPPCPKR